MSDIETLRQELTDHISQCDRRFEDGSKQFNELIQCTQLNTTAVTNLVNETRDVIQLYKDMQGVIRIGMKAQQFWMWVIKWPIIGGSLLAAYLWFKENFPS